MCTRLTSYAYLVILPNKGAQNDWFTGAPDKLTYAKTTIKGRCSVLIIGDEFQEQKPEELGDLAVPLYPAVDRTAVKGCFRFAIREALRALHLEEFKNVHLIAPERRMEFFDTLLPHARKRLEGFGLTAGQVDRLFERVRTWMLQFMR